MAVPDQAAPATPVDVEHVRQSSRLPSWPLTVAFAGFPLWWILGVVDFIWIPMAAAMMLYLIRARAALAPRGFGVWLLFLLWSALSVIALEHLGQLAVFGYRASVYVSCTVLFLYVYNSRQALSQRFVTGVLTIWWLITVAGGYLALLLPTAVVRTPMSFILPQAIVSNEWVNHMVVRRLNQYDPESFFATDPRPSAPFLYTNNWGNVFSLLLPFVIAYMLQVRGTRRFWVVAAVLPVGFVPAFMTLNRGMFLGMGIALVYLALRLALAGKPKGLVGLALVAVLAFTVYQTLPTAERLDSRAEQGGKSAEDRASLYRQSVDTIPDAPIFGHGVTLEAENPNLDPVGTQGQFWLVLVSHGLGAVLCFMGWFLTAWARSLRRRDVVGLTSNTVLLVGTIEFFYYGAVPYGLPIMMIAAALALRVVSVRQASTDPVTDGPTPSAVPALQQRPAGGQH